MQSLRTWRYGLSAALCLCGTFALAQEAPQAPASAVPASAVPASAVPAVPARIPAAPRAALAADPNVSAFFADQDPAAGGAVFLYADPNAAQADPGKYWVGLLCVDAGEALRQQLGLEEGVGLIVESVTDEAPAKKAGIQKHDVLLSVALPTDDPKAAPAPLRGVMALVEVVQKAETKPLKVTLLRRGQKQTVEVTPAERPQTPVVARVRALGQAEQQLHAILESQRKQTEAQGNVRQGAITTLRMAGPMYLPPAAQAPKLPEGMLLEFRQVVGQSERMLVSKGDQKWDVTAEELGKLPADVRAAVEQQLAFRRGAMAVPGVYGFAATPAAAMPTMVHVESRTTSSTLPEDLSISVTKKGSDPARITVRRREQSWEITEKELDKLPADVRKHVEFTIAPGQPMLPNYPARATMAWPAWKERMRPENQVRPQSAPPSSPTDQLQERQEAMLKQLQALTEKVEKLQQTLEKSTPKP